METSNGHTLGSVQLIMKLPLALALAAATVFAAPHIAHSLPRLPPSVTNRAQQNDVLYWYAQLPARHFAAFGNADRRQLLQQKGTIYDANRGFLEVPVPGDANKNDVEKLQVKLYRANAGLVIAVSTIVWNQPRVPGDLTLYGVTGAGTLLDVTKQLFPYNLQTAPQGSANGAPNGAAADGANAKPAPFQNAYLPLNGTTITTGLAESKEQRGEYLWDGNSFKLREAPAQNQNNG